MYEDSRETHQLKIKTDIKTMTIKCNCNKLIRIFYKFAIKVQCTVYLLGFDYLVKKFFQLHKIEWHIRISFRKRYSYIRNASNQGFRIPFLSIIKRTKYFSYNSLATSANITRKWQDSSEDFICEKISSTFAIFQFKLLCCYFTRISRKNVQEG